MQALHALPSPLCVITDRHRASLPLPQTLQAAVNGGARWIRVREPDLALSEYAALCHLLIEVVNSTRVTWSVRPSAYVLLRSVWPELRLGVHLTSVDAPWGAVHEDVLTGRSVHVQRDVHTPTAAGAADANDEQVDYRLLAPVFHTACKPDAAPIGLAAITGLLDAESTPVIALGGVTPLNAAECLRAGALGVAVCGGVMESESPSEVVREYLHELGHD